MLVVCDAEADGLDPTKFWVIVCKDETGKEYVFDRPYLNGYSEFKAFAKTVDIWVGHNFLGYDLPYFHKLIPDIDISPDSVIDTLVVSKLLHFNRPGGHSLEQYGVELGVPKISQEQWDVYDSNMIHRCTQDTRINYGVYERQKEYINSKRWSKALEVEHNIAWECNILHKNGFSFNTKEALKLLSKIKKELSFLDKELLKTFPPKPKLIREVLPRLTKHGTIAKNSIPKILSTDLSLYQGDAAFSHSTMLSKSRKYFSY